MFKAQEYQSRRKQLSTEISSGLLLLMGNNDSPMNYFDNAYHFRQDSTFLYYFGINEAKLVALIDIDENKTVLFGDEMTIDEIVWMGRQQTLAEKAFLSGIEDVRSSADLYDYIFKALKNNRPIHYLPPYRADNKIKLAELLSVNIQAVSVGVSVPFIKAVVKQRSVKSETELLELDRASEISADMHLLAMKMVKQGMTEGQIAAAVQQVAVAAGGNLAYPVILTKNGQFLHNHYHGNILMAGDLVLNDSGAETAMGYAGDLTRTFPVSKKFTTKQREIYDVVLNAYNTAVGALKPGVRYIDVHYTSCLALAEGLKSLGFMKGDMNEAVARGAHALFFQCGTGHMMGLDVHDMEDLGEQYVGYTDELKKNTTEFGLKSLRLGKALETGYVFTIEPGLYFIPELTKIWQAEKKFTEFINYDKVVAYNDFGGIRVEDDYVITGNSYRKLGKHLAINAEEVEQIREESV
ncbi:aminopeptidase P family protein [Pedobacter duraquae]|uniref:Xaa-Pro aminopeptidase n=1 Tax=Pedobacter duraquae TaxID=425511 RepID=A0A4R6IEV5_9SPHI|nr:aminopeptidase P family protein [Pedobacter duraquae]TDO20840.1 Xaa-Pro aminopeptidase [Pedobacter duraquae]